MNSSLPSSSSPSSANSRKSRRVNAPGARTDVGWEFKHHLARTHKDDGPCSMVPEDIKLKFQKVVEQIDLAASKKRRLHSVDEDDQFESDERTNQIDTFVSKKPKVQSTLNKIYKKEERDKVLRMVDSDLTPAMGFIYQAIKKAKKEIISNYKDVQSRYGPIINIIDERWDNQLNRPLHVAGYFLNPRMQYSPDFQGDLATVKANLYTCINKMYGNEDLANEIDCQLDLFKNRKGHLFNLNIARLSVDKKSPVDWWDSFGDDTPELKRFAICVHLKRRNCLHQQKMNDLVFVMYNLKLSEREEKKVKETAAAIEQLEALDFEKVDSDDEWITEEELTQSQAHDGGGDNVFLERAIRGQFGRDEFNEPDFDLHEENEVNAQLHLIDD
uniref:Zf-BED domain-containing protein n=1 Tax=Tanacetum cinerariifolium TaxID=118510 RepID=A0A6L2MUV6_TANCI|nr:zf-BED domain-containing protein [Tanacetum cinerariifolium]